MTPMRDDRGGVALLTLLGAMLLMCLGIVVVAGATDVMLTRSRASSAADAVALAAAASSPLAGGDGEPDIAAHHLAEHYEAVIDELDRSAWPTRVTVEVRIPTTLAMTRAVAPHISARATAELVPDP